MSARTETEQTIDTAKNSLHPAPSTHHYIEAGGVKLHYLDYGTAGLPPMLCLHGGAVNAYWFDFVAGAFTGDYHVRAFDQRGHGDSAWADPPDYSYDRYAADIAEVVEKLDLRDFVLMGHSMGGLVSLVYAATYPGRVKSLVIIDSTLRATPERVATLNEIGRRKGSTYASHEEFASQFRVRPEGTQAPAAMIRYLGDRSGRENADGLWRHKFDRNVYAKRVLIDIPPYWDRIAIPTLLVKGGLSERITPEIYDEIKSRSPNVERVVVPGSEHHVTLDNPEGLVQAVKAFLAKGNA
jgi:pimeloyl-ACP methyl ester carboxylesterase